MCIRRNAKKKLLIANFSANNTKYNRSEKF